METKKSKRANLENKRVIIFQSGLVIALSLVLVAFEWKTGYDKSELSGRVDFQTEPEWQIENTFRKEKPKPKIEVPKIEPVKFLMVENKSDIDDILEFNTEGSEDDFSNTEFYIEDKEEESVVPFYKVEEKPMFIGGDKALLRFLADNTKYPRMAVETGVQGRVYVEFVINEKGEIVDAKLLRSVHPLLDEEAIRVVKSMPKWKPGIQGGKKVPVSFNVPINFKLQ